MKNIRGSESVLILNKLYFKSFNFESEELGAEQVSPTIGVERVVEFAPDGTGFKTNILCRVESKGIFSLDITLVGEFTVEGGVNDSNKYLPDNSVAILFPYLRSQLTLLTAQPGMSPLVMPALNINKLLEADE